MNSLDEYLPGTDFSKSRTREVYGDSRDTWVEQAAAYARFEALSPERWGHKRVSKGGWVWKDLNDDDHQKWLDMREK